MFFFFTVVGGVFIFRVMIMFSLFLVLIRFSFGCFDWLLFWRFVGREVDVDACVVSMCRGFVVVVER